jgi:hypothetical protein
LKSSHPKAYAGFNVMNSGFKSKPTLRHSLLILVGLIGLPYATAYAQGFDGSQPSLVSAKVNVYCDPNGGNTGTCWTFEGNAPLDCQYASQDFIQCSFRATRQKLICLAYAPYQFACRQEVDAGVSTVGKQTIRPGIGESLPQNSSPQQPANQNQFHSDFVDVFSNQ